MKTKQIGLIALLAIITLALIACKEDDPPVEKEFTIHLTKSNKDVSLIDKREKPTKSLKELGIVDKLDEILNDVDGELPAGSSIRVSFDAVLSKGLTIEVAEFSIENDYVVVDNKTISLDFDYLDTADNISIGTSIVSAIASDAMKA